MAGRFWWTPIWLFLSLLFFACRKSLADSNKPAVAIFSTTLGILTLAFAVLGPWLLYGVLSNTAAAAAIVPTSPAAEHGGFFSGAWGFLTSVIRSGWGILYLVLAALLGRFWAGKWGWMLVPIALVLSAGILEWRQTNSSLAFTEFFQTAPVDHFTAILQISIARYSTAAWGVLLLGAGFCLLLLPVDLRIYRANRALARDNLIRQIFGTTIAARLLRVSGKVGPLTTLAGLIKLLIMIGMFVGVWMALSRLSQAQGALPFDLLRIVDLSLPRWKPTFQVPYLINGLIFGLIGFVLTKLQIRIGNMSPSFLTTAFTMLSALILSAFIPAGNILFLAGLTLGLFPAALGSIIGQGLEPRTAPPSHQRVAAEPDIDQQVAQERMEVLERMRRNIVAEAKQNDEDRAASAGQVVEQSYTSEPEEEPKLVGELLFWHPNPIYDLIPIGQNRYALRDNEDRIFRVEEATSWDASEITDLNQTKLHGIVPLSGGRIGAIGLYDKIFLLGQPVEEIQASFVIFHWAVNSFGTILTITNNQKDCVNALILGPKKEQTLVQGISQPTEMAFSADNRYLAIGTQGDGVSILDMASRKIVTTLADVNQAGVRQIRPNPAGGWVISFENDRIGVWDQQGKLLNMIETDQHVFCFAVEPQTGRVAMGNGAGEVCVYDAGLREISIEEAVHKETISVVLFETSGSLITAGGDGAVRRVKID